MKRVKHEVRFVRPKKGGDYWAHFQGRTLIQTDPMKDGCVKDAAEYCTRQWRLFDVRSELVIKRKDNSIQDTRTYGADPRRTKG